MRKIFYTLLLLLIISCGENKKEQPLVENAVDNADYSIKGSFESGRGENIIDKTYSELIKNDKKLSALDDKIVKIYESSNKVLAKYNTILYKSESFYRDAKYQTSSITDSILKQQIEDQIKISADKYNLKIKNVKDLIAQLNKNTEKMNDLYTAFKIRKTLPEIEKYQNAHPLKTDSLDNFIKKQNALLNELKSLK